MVNEKFEKSNKLTEDAARIRENVFINEQGFENEFDDIDKNAVHVVFYIDEKAVGVLRFFTDDKVTYHIGRVAVIKEYRKQHIGEKLMKFAEKEIKDIKGERIELSAQCAVAHFYESLGYKQVGDEYLDEFCPHIMMIKDI